LGSGSVDSAWRKYIAGSFGAGSAKLSKHVASKAHEMAMRFDVEKAQAAAGSLHTIGPRLKTVMHVLVTQAIMYNHTGNGKQDLQATAIRSRFIRSNQT
jgi:hypothetical protein